MKLKRSIVAATPAILSGVLSTAAMAHPGHGETGFLHDHSLAVIALTVAGILGFVAVMYLLHNATKGNATLTQVVRRYISRHK